MTTMSTYMLGVVSVECDGPYNATLVFGFVVKMCYIRRHWLTSHFIPLCLFIQIRMIVRPCQDTCTGVDDGDPISLTTSVMTLTAWGQWWQPTDFDTLVMRKNLKTYPQNPFDSTHSAPFFMYYSHYSLNHGVLCLTDFWSIFSNFPRSR